MSTRPSYIQLAVVIPVFNEEPAWFIPALASSPGAHRRGAHHERAAGE